MALKKGFSKPIEVKIDKVFLPNLSATEVKNIEKEFKAMKLATPVSEGWLFSKDDDTVRIFAGYDVEDDGSIHFSERSVLPTSCVKKMTKLN